MSLRTETKKPKRKRKRCYERPYVVEIWKAKRHDWHIEGRYVKEEDALNAARCLSIGMKTPTRVLNVREVEWHKRVVEEFAYDG